MLPLIIEKTQDTPEIILDKAGKNFSFSGNSIPEDAKKFYQPVFSWTEEYIANPNDETIVTFKMTYFNTSSTKSIFDIITVFKQLAKRGKMLIINWYFPKEDDDMKDAGEGLSNLVRIPFNFIKY